MALALYTAIFLQAVGWVYAERLPSSTDAPMASKVPISNGPNTSLKPSSALGGFIGFLLVVFAGIYLVRRRRSKAVDNVVEAAHFPTMAYNSGTPPPATDIRQFPGV
ncbi:hypothetical protein B0J17DRAFT_630978 [Rhizoctonia solani]|nr:hypothetical protein B0J17DRAFT_630978 [Rhizoctonia solani]